jgi:hypothetical protein
MQHRDEQEDLFDAMGVRPELHPIMSYLSAHSAPETQSINMLKMSARILKELDFKRARVLPSLQEQPETLISTYIKTGTPGNQFSNTQEKTDAVLVNEAAVHIQRQIDAAHDKMERYDFNVQAMPSKILIEQSYDGATKTSIGLRFSITPR